MVIVVGATNYKQYTDFFALLLSSLDGLLPTGKLYRFLSEKMERKRRKKGGERFWDIEAIVEYEYEYKCEEGSMSNADL